MPRSVIENVVEKTKYQAYEQAKPGIKPICFNRNKEAALFYQ